jgi:hypothetical protein
VSGEGREEEDGAMRGGMKGEELGPELGSGSRGGGGGAVAGAHGRRDPRHGSEELHSACIGVRGAGKVLAIQKIFLVCQCRLHMLTEAPRTTVSCSVA